MILRQEMIFSKVIFLLEFGFEWSVKDDDDKEIKLCHWGSLARFAILYAILGFEPIVSTNWIFDDDETTSTTDFGLFPIGHFLILLCAFSKVSQQINLKVQLKSYISWYR